MQNAKCRMQNYWGKADFIELQIASGKWQFSGQAIIVREEFIRPAVRKVCFLEQLT